MSQAVIAVQDIRRSTQPSVSLASQASQLLGIKAIRQQSLPGKPASTLRLQLENGKTLIASRRKYADRLDTESVILESLGRLNAAVPRFLGRDNDGLFLQEDLRGPSLAVKLLNANPGEFKDLVVPALKNLAKIHRIGSHQGFEEGLPLIGDSAEWRREFIHYPAKLGATLGIKPQAPDLKGLMELFELRHPRFIKWNARPTTTRVVKGQAYWVEWERAAVRQRMDDLVWFMGDETLPEFADEEARLVRAFVPYFSDGMGESEALDYFYAFGALHISVRLGVLLRHKGDNAWWSKEKAVTHPEVGVCQDWAINLCRRAQRWSTQSRFVSSLEPWFAKVKMHIKGLA